MFWNNTKMVELQAEIDRLRTELESRNVTITSCRNEISERDERISLLTAKAEEALKELGRAQREFENSENCIAIFRDENAALHQRLAQAEFDLHEARVSKKLSLDALVAQESLSNDLHHQLHTAQLELEDSTSARAELYAELEAVRTVQDNLECELAACRKSEEALQEKLSVLERRNSEQRKALESYRNSAANQAFKLRDLEWTISVLGREIERRRSWIEDLARDRNRYADELTRAREDLSEFKTRTNVVLANIVAQAEALSVDCLRPAAASRNELTQSTSRSTPSSTGETATSAATASKRGYQSKAPASRSFRQLFNHVMTASQHANRLRYPRRTTLRPANAGAFVDFRKFSEIIYESRDARRRISLEKFHSRLGAIELTLRPGQLRRILTITQLRWS